MSTRRGGISQGPFTSLNLGSAVGDDPSAVAHNRACFARSLEGATPIFLKQVHGTRVVRLSRQDLVSSTDLVPRFEADAAVCTERGVACTVQVADCLPALFSAPSGEAVGAAHAGWRGLAAGVLEATLEQICLLAPCRASEVHVWLGPCIGPRQFEVGPEVAQAFGGGLAGCFQPGEQPGKSMANLPQLARARLVSAGVPADHVHGGPWCTVEDASRFFSFRRDGITGRMAAAIWRAVG